MDTIKFGNDKSFLRCQLIRQELWWWKVWPAIVTSIYIYIYLLGFLDTDSYPDHRVKMYYLKCAWMMVVIMYGSNPESETQLRIRDHIYAWP